MNIITNTSGHSISYPPLEIIERFVGLTVLSLLSISLSSCMWSHSGMHHTESVVSYDNGDVSVERCDRRSFSSLEPLSGYVFMSIIGDKPKDRNCHVMRGPIPYVNALIIDEDRLPPNQEDIATRRVQKTAKVGMRPFMEGVPHAFFYLRGIDYHNDGTMTVVACETVHSIAMSIAVPFRMAFSNDYPLDMCISAKGTASQVNKRLPSSLKVAPLVGQEE